MKATRTLIAVNALLVAILACNLPAGPSPMPSPDLAGTVTAEAMILMQSSSTPTFAQIPASSEVPSQTPTPFLPADPSNLHVVYSCTKSLNPFPHNKLHVDITWQDNATNEAGYYIFRDGTLLATLAADASSFSDDTTMASFVLTGSPVPHISYAIQAFNGAGQSGKISKSISCFD